ncbi:polysaccharide pyruvyl transferase family protein [Azoarcus sp. KH32C]|uniref:polysaccharide pyruvyl transferase family protein n=1 Tax=Azoarcus sp. KH32C TaxID=748247 RepID=UPI0002386B1C|nr:polysaccharide pyruvyl transferase family protein [Azoarcus sp. KH32C]BAL23288.1 pyruvyltransferase [Azoarcus sp. KH32C]
MLNKFRNLLQRPPAPQAPIAAPLPYGHVSLFHWRPLDGRVNFGDHLSQIVVSRLLAERSLTLDDEVEQGARLLAIGSILHFAGDGDVIWGSGVNGKVPESCFTAKRLDVRAVRGPLTEEFLRARGHRVPAVYGDPALLVPLLFGGRFRPTGEQALVFVPNLHDLPFVAGKPNVVSPLSGWNTVITEILKARLVLASSLHGLVIAEAFGIPARYVRLSDTENLFKYQDYYYGTGRGQFEYAKSIPEGLEMGGMPSFSFDPQPLLAAFPWDLWRQSARTAMGVAAVPPTDDGRGGIPMSTSETGHIGRA